MLFNLSSMHQHYQVYTRAFLCLSLFLVYMFWTCLHCLLGISLCFCFFWPIFFFLFSDFSFLHLGLLASCLFASLCSLMIKRLNCFSNFFSPISEYSFRISVLNIHRTAQIYFQKKNDKKVECHQINGFFFVSKQPWQKQSDQY